MKHSAATQATLAEMDAMIAHHRRNPLLPRNAAMTAAIAFELEEEAQQVATLNAWDEEKAEYAEWLKEQAEEQAAAMRSGCDLDHGDLTIDEYLAGGREAYEAQQNDDYSFFR